MPATWIDTETRSPLHISLAAGTLTLSLNEEINLSFDGEGRMVGAWFQGLTYRRGLDNRVLLKWSDRAQNNARQRRFLAKEERRELLERVYGLAGDAAIGLANGRFDTSDGDGTFRKTVGDWLARVQPWTWPRLEAEADRFGQVYKPVSIMPPDQYLALVLQATEGCSYNECSFCTFYRDRPFRSQSPASFAEHLDRVDWLLGRGRTVRRSIFLADANAVIMPQTRLLHLLDLVNERYPILPADATPADRISWKNAHPWQLSGIYAFVSAPDALRKTPQDFLAMRQRNVRRLYVGLESGHDPLRRFLRKQGDAVDVLRAVETMKAGDLEVGIILMVGVGGVDFQQAHFRDTLELIARMPLGMNDLVYLSPFVPDADSPYAADAAAAKLIPLDDAALQEEEARFRTALRSVLGERGVRIARYDIREFLY
jgi:hypothetical protein